jgi:SAM-dependent methyltransferase
VEPTNWADVFADLSQRASKKDLAGLQRGRWRSASEIRAYLLTFQLDNAPEGFIEQYLNDALPRFLKTLEFIPLPCSGPILEIGSNPYLFQLLLRKVFPQAEIQGCNYFDHNIFLPGSGELTQVLHSEGTGERHTFTGKLLNIEVVEEYPYANAQFDLILFCETLEHLIVNPLAVFSRLRRILKPGGRLLITLPNAVRLSNVALMLEGRNFFDIYSTNGPHEGIIASTRWKKWCAFSNGMAIESKGRKRGTGLTTTSSRCGLSTMRVHRRRCDTTVHK